ncbi:GNAT family N-acetyltransferase [Heyndrickxia oleronia]|jgi:ribosomal-protein-serine acetyltransferase|uniref:GNAT family N-acetyltransferase n=1 Tax=Heyndrickxia oleronia TaxID=38875 RepID=UPI00203C266B|nr:GNAT family protein [Heyndrickxia oleronia]MCI1592819.1 GNAT family N-acetyltransferase [Heyndrickxia oleronia]MCI1614788.1 GNAT family N-acetyltransferase [Heyndrickxia oleronia]MCI1762674.1 GNAT family N-acetyltransferase [Heyndrickxia oleronia]MCM3456218.1 GNAT family N-acetyltransferase [Heyndrickxia oleronia]
MFIHKINDDLALKLIELKDSDRVFELTDTSRNYLREWLPWLDTTIKLEDTIGFINMCLKGFSENRSINTVILFKGNIVGVAGFNNINWSNKTAQIGYWLGEEYQGYGIMTRVAEALTEYAFKELALNKVEIRVAVGNKKSRSIPERLGFINEGCIRQAEWLYDHYVDHVVYGILSEEWSNK